MLDNVSTLTSPVHTYSPDTTTTTCLISGITRGQCTPQRTLTTSGHPPRYSLFLPRFHHHHLSRAHIWPVVVVVTRALAETMMMMIYGPDPLPYHCYVVCCRYCYCPRWPCRRNHSHSSLSSAARMAGDRWATGFSWAINQILQTFARLSVSIVRRRNPLHHRAGGYPYRVAQGLGPANLCTGNSRPHFRLTAAAAVVVVRRTRQRGRMTGRHRLFRLRSCRCPQPMMVMGVLPFSAGGSRIVCDEAAAVAGSGYTFD